ncbi:MAG: Fe-S cluster protein [Crocinitomicaceae bacterium]|nr:Fe-S cluster protein [Crocinitomicaceae bacterium]|tara:strand:+ start:499 stop:1404 length:906 start_codon:yes stop_codon:yes gene_type:complete
MTNEIIIALVIITGLGLLFGVILAVSYKKLKVYEDPRLDTVEEMLPNTNCGACGVPGCRAFAEKLIANELVPSGCTVSSPEGIENIAEFLGVDAGEANKRVARLLCAGGKNEAHNLANYKGGIGTCRGEAVVTGGSKDCSWGCLGLGDCAVSCDFDALFMNSNGLPEVIPEKCTACSDCVDACPKELFVLMPVEQKLIVQCRSLLEGDLAESKCSVACTACARCVADAEEGVIEIKNNLAVINYNHNDLATPLATMRCPTNAIVWLEGEAQFEKPREKTLALGGVETNMSSGEKIIVTERS